MRTEVKIGIGVGILLAAVVVCYLAFGPGKKADNQADNRVATANNSSSSGISYDSNRPGNHVSNDVWGMGNTNNAPSNTGNTGGLWTDATAGNTSNAANTANNAGNTSTSWGNASNASNATHNNASNNSPWGNFTLGNNTANNATGNNAGGNNAANNAGSSSETRTYVVKENDSFWTIAAKPEVYGNGSLHKLLEEANKGVDARSLRVGTVLKVPPAPKKDTPAAGAGTDTGSSMGGAVTGGSTGKKYIVADGDTLWSIAKKVLGNGAKKDLLIKANPGLSSNIKRGQTINLPDEATVAADSATSRPASTTTRPAGTTHRPSSNTGGATRSGTSSGTETPLRPHFHNLPN